VSTNSSCFKYKHQERDHSDRQPSELGHDAELTIVSTRMGKHRKRLAEHIFFSMVA
jgi:hypothetical protein